MAVARGPSEAGSAQSTGGKAQEIRCGCGRGRRGEDGFVKARRRTDTARLDTATNRAQLADRDPSKRVVHLGEGRGGEAGASNRPGNGYSGPRPDGGVRRGRCTPVQKASRKSQRVGRRRQLLWRVLCLSLRSGTSGAGRTVQTERGGRGTRRGGGQRADLVAHGRKLGRARRPGCADAVARGLRAKRQGVEAVDGWLHTAVEETVSVKSRAAVWPSCLLLGRMTKGGLSRCGRR